MPWSDDRMKTALKRSARPKPDPDRISAAAAAATAFEFTGR